jgi:hypothetical protein
MQDAASAGEPRLAGRHSTRTTRTLPWCAKVNTDPILIGLCARSMGLPSIRKWPFSAIS